MNDLKFALRSLLKSPGYTLVAVLTLALGIGASTAIFSVVNGVVLQPLAYPTSEQLVAIRTVLPAYAKTYPTLPVNARFYFEWANCPAFSGLALMDRAVATLTGSGEPASLAIVRTSANLLSTLRVKPALGRDFVAGEDAEGQPPVALISHRLWRDRFASDPTIIDRTITLNQSPVTVIGVLPRDFRIPEARQYMPNGAGSDDPDVILPKTMSASEREEIIGRFNYNVIGRLAPGATSAEALAQMQVVAARLTKLAGDEIEVHGFVAPLQEAVVGPARRGLFLLLGAIVAVLLIACLNLAILALARAERRSRDNAVRAALGASRIQLLRQSLAESLLLSLVGGTLGCLFAAWGIELLLAFAPVGLPRLNEVGLDGQVLLFAFAATIATAVVAGLIPAWRTARCNAADTLRSAATYTVAGGAGSRRLRETLVAVEVCVSTVLLALAALLGGSFIRLMQVDAGFKGSNVVSVELVIPSSKYSNGADLHAYDQRLLAAVAATSGVKSAAISTVLPLQGETWVDSFWAPGDTRPQPQRPSVNVRFISADYFATMGMPLVAGRTFRDSDRDRKVAVISAQLAALTWPGQDPIGRMIERPGSQQWEVIGVVGDVRANVDQRAVPVLYWPYWAWTHYRVILVVRTEGSPALVTPAIRQAIRGVDPDVPVQAFRTMDDILRDSVAQRRFNLQLAGVFALSALTLAGLGIYGVVSHGVTQRTRELGIRIAFGASAAAVRSLILRQGLKPIGFGLLGGIAAALLGGRLLAGLLYETKASDPLTLAAVAGVLALTGVFACWIPARRATRVNPVEALKAE